MLARTLKLAEKKTNHSQIVNIVIEENKTETLEKKVAQLGEELSKKIEKLQNRNMHLPFLQMHRTFDWPILNTNDKSIHANITSISHYVPKSKNLPATTSNSKSKLASRVLKPTRPNQQANTNYPNFQPTYLNISENLNLGNINDNIPETENITNSQNLIQTIPLAIIMEDSSLTAIFSFELEEKETMFSGAALDEKHPITVMYTEAKWICRKHCVTSIINHTMTFQIITANRSIKLSHGKIDSFLFEINGIIIPTKVLVIDTTQYQVLVENDWLTKANATLDWTIQEFLISYNGHYARIPVTCGYFQKPSTNQRPIFEFEENSALLAIETYQLLTKLPAVPTWRIYNKKLLSMTVYSAPDKDPRNSTHYYCNHYNKKKYSYPKRHEKWDEKPCLACKKLLPKECDWIDMPGRGGMCDTTCQYTILICNWIRGGTLFEAVFNRALRRLQYYSHDEDELYNTAQTKNNSEKPYTIKSKEKIAQAIFLPLVKIGKFVPVENHKELIQTTRGTFGFGLTEKRIEANFTETIEEKGKLIKTKWSITLMPYGKSEIKIKRTIKNINLIFEPHPKTCQQFLIGLTNFFIPADKTQWIKILIMNTTEKLIYIPENTIMKYLGTELENVSTLQEILNFSEIIFYCELTSINWQQPLECYQFMPEKLAKLNIRTMNPDQQ
ncbi:hypothetical protein G9A89_023872 [Geosiphon pyriformis]|nr:hypothetical protein G9A89_023872 [Geosiphon pyriformis]